MRWRVKIARMVGSNSTPRSPVFPYHAVALLNLLVGLLQL